MGKNSKIFWLANKILWRHSLEIRPKTFQNVNFITKLLTSFKEIKIYHLLWYLFINQHFAYKLGSLDAEFYYLSWYYQEILLKLLLSTLNYFKYSWNNRWTNNLSMVILFWNIKHLLTLNFTGKSFLKYSNHYKIQKNL